MDQICPSRNEVGKSRWKLGSVLLPVLQRVAATNENAAHRDLFSVFREDPDLKARLPRAEMTLLQAMRPPIPRG